MSTTTTHGNSAGKRLGLFSWMNLMVRFSAFSPGVVSTWIAVIVLAGSGSYVFATFFKSLFLCTTLGMLHGLILLPVVLSILNPGTIHSTSTHDDEHEEHQKLAIP